MIRPLAAKPPADTAGQQVPDGAATGSRFDAEALAGAHLTPAKIAVSLAVLMVLLFGGLLLAAACGSVHVSLYAAFSAPASADHAILFSVRLPRVLMGAVVGAVLATVGVALQALVRNPLAEGGILGISGGGALGAIGAMILFYRSPFLAELVPLTAFTAALAATVVVYRLSQVHGVLEPFTLLLIGVILNAFFGAAIMLVNSVVNFYYAHSILFWLMGSLAASSYRQLLVVGAFGLAGFGVLMAAARDLNLMSLGDEAAAELGVSVDRLRRTIFLATSVMVGAAVSVSGIISFVGLLVPHVLRVLLGSDHRLLLPASMLAGAAFMVVADLVARVAIAPAELPVGAITALCGGPFFVYALRHGGRGTAG